ncbi:hypothetical protein FH583_21560 (plasmid) [Leptospira interrogans]|uniref:hypothetical protein n=1 Tax=Leptospira interrogans TaxID=173 RepID=UPI001F059EFA|nr:hypothetical protein [Leptospira interrogans]UML78411.1 hypothetical protein FH583_21710 [Leptospira interrogans]UML78467.1 hypothetical protein FH583_21560 [Leptospira interrogans]
MKIVDLEIDGKTTKAVIGAFPESKKALVQKKDIISMEFDASVDEDKSESAVAQFIGKAIDVISAIALGESSTDTPGFAGARALSELQAFTQTTITETPKGKSNMPTIEEVMAALNTDIVRSWVDKNKNVLVGMIFSEDRYLPDFIEDENAKGTGKGHFKNGEKSIRKILNENQDKLNKAMTDIEAERKEITLRTERANATSSVLETVKGKKLPEAVRKELESRIQELDMEAYKTDKSKAISTFVEKVVDSELKVIARHQGEAQAKKLREDWFKDSKGKETPPKESTETKDYLEEEDEDEEESENSLSLPKDED